MAAVALSLRALSVVVRLRLALEKGAEGANHGGMNDDTYVWQGQLCGKKVHVAVHASTHANMHTLNASCN